jgi:hypothetical protein
MPLRSEYRKTLLALLLFAVAGCSTIEEDDTAPVLEPFFDNITYFRFTEDTEGWVGNFAEYPGEREDSLQLDFTHTTLPSVFEKEGSALCWSGFNFYNSLFMFGYYHLTSLEPSTEYVFTFDVEAGYQVLQGNQFLLGDHEQKIFIKSGVINFEPFTYFDESNGRMVTNFDQGEQQSIGGDHMRVLGSIDIGELSQKDKILSNPAQTLFRLKTNERGEVWLLLGAESSVPLKHAFYLDTIIAYYEKVQNP